MDDKKIHLAGRIDQVVRDYFLDNSTVSIVLAKDLMPLFVTKGIFLKDHRAGLPIRNLLRELDAENKLDMLKHCKVIRKNVNRNWYFERSSRS